MKILDSIVFLAEMTSVIHETEFSKQGKIMIKNFKIQNNLSFAKNIPDFKIESIKIGEQNVMVGTVIKRPLAVSLISKLEFHYGVVLGTATNGESIIIEMTNENNVRLSNLKQFLQNYNLADLIIERNKSNLKLNDIIERAKIYQFESYSLLDLNCKDFAYFVAYQINPNKRSIIAKKCQLKGIEFAINYRKLQLSAPENKGNSKFLISLINKLEEKRKIIEKELEITIK